MVDSIDFGQGEPNAEWMHSLAMAMALAQIKHELDLVCPILAGIATIFVLSLALVMFIEMARRKRSRTIKSPCRVRAFMERCRPSTNQHVEDHVSLEDLFPMHLVEEKDLVVNSSPSSSTLSTASESNDGMWTNDLVVIDDANPAATSIHKQARFNLNDEQCTIVTRTN